MSSMCKSSATLMEKTEGSALQMFYLKSQHHKNQSLLWESSASLQIILTLPKFVNN